MNRRFVLGLCAAFLVQTGIVGAMVWSRAAVLRTGQEITLRSTFVDPRDIFRGHYVQLDLGLDLPEGAPSIAYGNRVYVTMREGEDGFWVAESVHPHFPAGSSAPVLRADGISSDRIFLPFDRYFADRDRALELENLRRDQRLGVILALDGRGGAVIAGLTVDGEKVYDEPFL